MPGYADKAMETAGLVITGDGGKRYDRFRDRIMFPIHDGGGRVIGFGGRVLDKGEPKYLNSPETPLFSKGRELYGLFQARQAIRAAGRVVVVEGYMDVVALAQHGVDYAVATLGTATTPVHVQKLFRLTDTRRVLLRRRCRRTARRVARAGKHAGRCSPTARMHASCFCPTARIRTTTSASAARNRSRRWSTRRRRCRTSCWRSWPSAIRRARPKDARRWSMRPSRCWREITAPVLATLLRRGLAELAGLRETEMDTLLPVPRAVATAAVRTRPQRMAPSLLRGILQCVLLEPDLTHRFEVPEPVGAGAEGDALAAVVAHCRASAPPLTTAGVLQQFAGSPHEGTLMAALTTGKARDWPANCWKSSLSKVSSAIG